MTPSERLKRAYDIASAKLDYVYVGNIDLPGTNDTRCPACKSVLVKRYGYASDVVGIDQGCCAQCQRKVDIPPVKPNIINIDDCPQFITKDRSKIREIMAPRNSIIQNQSLAEAVVHVGSATDEHYHRKSEEIYFILSGVGEMRVDGEHRAREGRGCRRFAARLSSQDLEPRRHRSRLPLHLCPTLRTRRHRDHRNNVLI